MAPPELVPPKDPPAEKAPPAPENEGPADASKEAPAAEGDAPMAMSQIGDTESKKDAVFELAAEKLVTDPFALDLLDKNKKVTLKAKDSSLLQNGDDNGQTTI